MLVVAYLLRRPGEKLPADEVRAHPVCGWLYLGQDTRKVYPSVAARLFRSDRDQVDLLEPLVYASVKKIERGGILLVGKEEVRSSLTQAQAWFCVPGPLDDLTMAGGGR